jgi:hypothetical protein
VITNNYIYLEQQQLRRIETKSKQGFKLGINKKGGGQTKTGMKI